MGAPRAWTSISGQTAAGKEIVVSGEEALRTIRIDPDLATIAVDTGANPPRVVVSAAMIIAGLDARVAALEAQLAALLARVDVSGSGVALKNDQAQTVFEVGTRSGQRALGFYGKSPLQQKVNVGPTPTAGDIATDLAAKGLLDNT